MINGTLVPIVADADLACGAGATVVVYGQPMPFINRAAWINAFVMLFTITGTSAAVRIWSEWSVDGITWTTGPDLMSLGAGAMGVPTPGTRDTGLTAGVDHFGPLVRINVSLYAATAGTARVTAVLNVRFF